MKRWLAWVLLLLILCASAAAEDLGALSDYLAAADVSALGASAWTEEAGGRVLSVSPSADAMVSLCAEGGRLVAISVTAPKGDLCEKLARLALLPGGWIDEAALDAMLEKGEGGAAGDALLTLVQGELREGVYLCAKGEMDDLYWQPLHGGKDRHKSLNCSGMDVPRLITGAAADALNLPPCEKCAGGKAE